jgi:hypothetical protein
LPLLSLMFCADLGFVFARKSGVLSVPARLAEK